MRRYEAIVEAEKDLAEFSLILQGWYRSRESDSVRTQRMRDSEFGIGRRYAEKLIYGVQPEHQLQLAIGNEAVTAYYFLKGAYDMEDMRIKDLEPRSILELRRARDMHTRLIPPYKLELAVGGYNVVPLSGVAKTLTEGGELTIIEHPADPKN